MAPLVAYAVAKARLWYGARGRQKDPWKKKMKTRTWSKNRLGETRETLTSNELTG